MCRGFYKIIALSPVAENEYSPTCTYATGVHENVSPTKLENGLDAPPGVFFLGSLRDSGALRALDGVAVASARSLLCCCCLGRTACTPPGDRIITARPPDRFHRTPHHQLPDSFSLESPSGLPSDGTNSDPWSPGPSLDAYWATPVGSAPELFFVSSKNAGWVPVFSAGRFAQCHCRYLVTVTTRKKYGVGQKASQRSSTITPASLSRRGTHHEKATQLQQRG